MPSTSARTPPGAQTLTPTDGSPQPEESLDRFWGAVAGLVLPVVGKAASSLLPKAGSAIGGLFGSSGAAIGGQVGGAAGGILGGLFGRDATAVLEAETSRAVEEAQVEQVATNVMGEVIPYLIDELNRQTQDRASRGETGPFDDEAMERSWLDIVNVVTKVAAEHLPTAIKTASKIFGGFMGSRDVDQESPLMIDAEVAQRFFAPTLASVICTIQSQLPQLFQIVQSGAQRSIPRDAAISWQDLETTQRLWDNDNIALIGLTLIEDPDAVEIMLELAPHKSWWKGVQIQDSNGKFVKEATVESGRKVDFVRVPAQVLLSPGGYLVFSKSKAFGVHTGMYRLPTAGLDQLRGKSAHFFWYAD